LTYPSTSRHGRLVLDGGQYRYRDVVASALGWWADAGVDTLADEAPRDWLAPPPAKPQIVPSTPLATATPVATGLPETIEALHALLANGDYAPSPAPPRLRVAPSGDPAADLMIVADMPDPGDAEAGHLFAGETATLFDAMLAALGLNRTRIYLVPFSPARAAGRLDPRQSEALATLTRRHIALASPKALILFGDSVAQGLLGPDALATRGGIRSVNHDRGMVPAIATFHPRHLRRMPALKAAVWTDMRLLLGVLAR
jgi:uracil-DNA glycosylase family 4